MALSTSTSTLAAGASRTFNLSPGSALTLVAPPNVRATVTETPNTVSASDVGGNASRTHNLQMVQTVTYGPYPMGGTVVVANASNSGATITWVRSDSIVAESAAGAVSLVSGDGTLPIAVSLLATALPMLLPSSGSVGANGALTLTTAIPLSGGYSWGCFMYFPANAVYSASAAGLYYVVMSSNSAGTIYNNTYTSGTPTVPTSLTPIVDAGPGAYTQTTSPVDLSTLSIAANAMGRNGRIIHQPAYVFPNNANNKVISTAFGSSNVYAKTRTTATQETPLIDIRNRGVTNRQLSAWANSGGPAVSSTAGVVNTSIDTTAAVNLVVRGQLAVATDFIILESQSVELVPFQ